jgi:hypothetical protein
MDFIFGIFFRDLNETLFIYSDNSGEPEINKLIQSKIKTSKLKESNPTSFYKMINQIYPELIDKQLELNLNEMIDTNMSVFRNIARIFFGQKSGIVAYINTNQKLKDLFYRAINSEKIKYFDLNEIFNSNNDFLLKRYYEFVEQYPDYENSRIYKAGMEWDQKVAETYKKEIEKSTDNTLRHKFMVLSFFKTPPNLSEFNVSGRYEDDLSTIKIKSVLPIESLKFLPKSFTRGGGLDLSNCILKNNIDYLPNNIIHLDLEHSTVSPDKDLVLKGITGNVADVTLRNVKNLKTLKGLNQFNNVKNLRIFKCDDLISLEGSPSVVSFMEISGCDKLKNFEGGPSRANEIKIVRMDGLVNFVGCPEADRYTLSYTRINSFKGLPNNINELNFAGSISEKTLIRKSYSYFPNRIKILQIHDQNSASKSSFKRYFFSRILNVIPSFIGNVVECITNQLRHPTDDTLEINPYSKGLIGDPFWDKVIKTYIKNFNASKNKTQEVAESTQMFKQERISSNLNKISNRQKIKRLSKEELENITPFNVLLEDILNTIKTSFKVYK